MFASKYFTKACFPNKYFPAGGLFTFEPQVVRITVNVDKMVPLHRYKVTVEVVDLGIEEQKY